VFFNIKHFYSSKRCRKLKSVLSWDSKRFAMRYSKQRRVECNRNKHKLKLNFFYSRKAEKRKKWRNHFSNLMMMMKYENFWCILYNSLHPPCLTFMAGHFKIFSSLQIYSPILISDVVITLKKEISFSTKFFK
jgi:hypothetical protein